MPKTPNRNRATTTVALLAAMLMLAVLTGCSAASKDETPRGGADTPIVAAQQVRGALPGAQIVAVATLPKPDQDAIVSWIAAEMPANKLPTLATGTYTPTIEGHVLEAAREVGNENGIAVPIVTLHFDPEGTQTLGSYSAAHAGETVAVVLDGRVVAATKVAEPITDGVLQFDGTRDTLEPITKSIVPTTP